MSVPYPPPSKSRVPTWLWIVGGVLLLGVVLCCLGSCVAIVASGGSNTNPSSSASPSHSPSTVPTSSAPSPDPTTPPATTPPATTPPATQAPPLPPLGAVAQTFEDGSYIVGTDVAPGRYRSPGASEGFIELCSVSTKDASGNMDDWETSAKTTAPVLITLKVGQTVKASGCQTFAKIG